MRSQMFWSQKSRIGLQMRNKISEKLLLNKLMEKCRPDEIIGNLNKNLFTFKENKNWMDYLIWFGRREREIKNTFEENKLKS